MPENGSVNGGAGRDTPDRSDNNDRGGGREDEAARAEKAESFDRAMDNANRPDRASATPPETTTASDDDEDDNNTDKPDDTDDRGILDRAADTLTAPPTDAEGNARSNSPVADRIGNHTVNYSVDDLKNVFTDDPGLTPEQSQSLADGAAVMDGVTTVYNKPAATPRNAAIQMANVELSVELQVGRREFEEANAAKLDQIDQGLAAARTERGEALERYEAAATMEYDEFGVQHQAGSFEIEEHAASYKAASDRVSDLETERAQVQRDRDIPDAIERSLIAEDSYSATSHLTGSGLERLTDDQLPEGLKSSDMINTDTGFAAYAYENRRTGSVELVTRGTDFGVGMDEFARDMRANFGEGIGVPTAQSEQAVDVGVEFVQHYNGHEMHVTGHSLGGTNASTVSAATGIEGTVFNSGPVHDHTLEGLDVTREGMAERVTNYRVEGELVTSGLESPVVDGALGITSPAIAAVATIRNGGDPIPNAVGDPRDLPAANPESSMLEKHGTREVVQSLVQEQQRVIDEHREGQSAPR